MDARDVSHAALLAGALGGTVAARCLAPILLVAGFSAMKSRPPLTSARS